MPSRKEIREGLKDKLFVLSGGKMYAEYTDGILKYLHSQGVVIKVDRGLPDIMTRFGGLKQADRYQREIVEAGYEAVESLLEEK